MVEEDLASSRSMYTKASGCDFLDLVEDLGCIFVSREGGGRSGQI
ncbi:hypothetical protein HanXRQr2_Chr15g0672901 [Helianthus annuus]|uniref:Uncharacterized protein n=1 Tax=Helianthus annuus TaxID=4232 RepID=A0A9K3DWQ1_HELAN|nr:hypothetical protein HanXRQr2_Chr15g0672901 [Helianthus annuus]